MKIGLLESRLDPFVNDLQARLASLPVEFVSFPQQLLPLKTEYGVVVDRMSFHYPYLAEMLKNLALNGTYVINNPFAAMATNKMVELRICSDLGISFPRTVILPDTTAQGDLGEMLGDFDGQRAADEVGLPCIVKPYDGSGWEHVYTANSLQELQGVYEKVKHRHVVLVQRIIRYRDYFRVFCIGKQDVLFSRWVPRPQGMGQYLPCDASDLGTAQDYITQDTLRLNVSLDLDVNAVEWCLDEEGKPWLIEAFNEVPDIDKRSIPQPQYDWLVDRFAALVKKKFYSTDTNRTILGARGW